MKLTDRYPNVDALPRTIPVFPLTGLLMLPRAVLPLNIFEPRYLQLFDDALAGARLVGIIQPARHVTDAESPEGKSVALRNVGCVGRITAYQEVEDGRLIIQLTGVARFSAVQEVDTPRQYRSLTVDYSGYASDTLIGHGADEVDRDELIVGLKRFLEARDMKADWDNIRRAPTEQLVNALSIMSPYGSEEKQALLEAPDLKTRATLLVALAEMELAAGPRGGPGTLLQ